MVALNSPVPVQCIVRLSIVGVMDMGAVLKSGPCAIKTCCPFISRAALLVSVEGGRCFARESYTFRTTVFNATHCCEVGRI